MHLCALLFPVRERLGVVNMLICNWVKSIDWLIMVLLLLLLLLFTAVKRGLPVLTYRVTTHQETFDLFLLLTAILTNIINGSLHYIWEKVMSHWKHKSQRYGNLYQPKYKFPNFILTNGTLFQWTTERLTVIYWIPKQNQTNCFLFDIAESSK